MNNFNVDTDGFGVRMFDESSGRGEVVGPFAWVRLTGPVFIGSNIPDEDARGETLAVYYGGGWMRVSVTGGDDPDPSARRLYQLIEVFPWPSGEVIPLETRKG